MARPRVCRHDVRCHECGPNCMPEDGTSCIVGRRVTRKAWRCWGVRWRSCWWTGPRNPVPVYVENTCGGNAGGCRLDPNAGAVFGQHHPVGAVPGGVLRRPVRDEVARAGGGTARRGANAQCQALNEPEPFVPVKYSLLLRRLMRARPGWRGVVATGRCR